LLYKLLPRSSLHFLIKEKPMMNYKKRADARFFLANTFLSTSITYPPYAKLENQTFIVSQLFCVCNPAQ
jgi:hypothetical protein